MEGQQEQQQQLEQQENQEIFNDNENNIGNNNDDEMSLISADESDNSDEHARRRCLAFIARRDHAIGLLVGNYHLNAMPTWQREDAYRLIKYFRLTEQCDFDRIMNDMACTNLEDVAYALRRFSTLADLWMHHHDFKNLGTIMYTKIRAIEAGLKTKMDNEGIGSTTLREDKFKKTVRAAAKLELNDKLEQTVEELRGRLDEQVHFIVSSQTLDLVEVKTGEILSLVNNNAEQTVRDAVRDALAGLLQGNNH